MAVVLVRVVVVKGDNKMPKFYGQNKKRIDPRYFLHENITYRVIEDEDDGGPTVQIQGSDVSFIEMVNDLDGKVIDFEDGDAPEVFNFSDMNNAEDAEDAAEYMVQNNIAKYYVEVWARMNNLEATQAGGFN